MTGDEALAQLLEAAETVSDWYRQGGNPDAPIYKTLMSNLDRWVQVYRHTTTTNRPQPDVMGSYLEAGWTIDDDGRWHPPAR